MYVVSIEARVQVVVVAAVLVVVVAVGEEAVVGCR